jgi:hypothetical protein
MADETRQAVSATIGAPPEAVFALLADPSRHPDIDGSGMLQGAAAGSKPITGTGQSFVMDMYAEALGKYQIRNQVIAFEPGRRIAWKPEAETLSPEIVELLGDIVPGGHHFAFDLEPTGDGQTLVTHTYDWGGLKDERFAAFCPLINTEQMSKTVSLLGAAVGQPRS